MLSLINTARIVAPLVAAHNEVAALKIRFVSLYQTALKLQRLLGDTSLRNEARKRINALINADPVANVLANQQLPNDLVHYGVPKRTSPQLSSKATLFGLEEAHPNGQSFEDVGRRRRRRPGDRLWWTARASAPAARPSPYGVRMRNGHTGPYESALPGANNQVATAQSLLPGRTTSRRLEPSCP